LKITIVTISLNQGKYLERAIQSVIGQEDADLDYIVVDAGSTDGSRSIIDKYSGKISKIIFEKDNGPSDGLNKGFSYARGDIYGFINADYCLLPGALKKVSDYFVKYPETDVLSGNGYLIDQNDKILHSMFSFRLSGNKFDILRFAHSCSCLVQQSTFFKKDIFKQAGGFNCDFKNIWDGALFLDFALSGATFRRVNDYWSCFRFHPDSMTGSGAGLPNNEFGKIYYELLLNKVTNNNATKSLFWFYRIAGWLTEPKLLLLRIYDQIKYPVRYL
jgi:glycosyltransferase involved in cell wall biosynthesis